MTEEQAKRLGELLRKARTKRGLSLRAVAELADVKHIWLLNVEDGRHTSPAADRLARISEVLGIDPVKIDRLSDNSVADSLPGVRTYFRSKDRLTAAQLDDLEATLTRLRAKYAKQNESKKGGTT